MPNATGQKTCFVVMGFGEKTDFQANPQRVLNLNRTFEDIIEPAVTESGLECIRADKIIHSKLIDQPMYENLLEADLVIADLSTSNANALYELGVRHGLRPRSTIVMAEQNFTFPFDLNHLSIAKYTHLGTEIGFKEVMRMRQVLKDRIGASLADSDADSPVFMFLPKLLGGGTQVAPAPSSPKADDKSFADLLEMFRKAKAKAKKPVDWQGVLEILERIQNLQPNDPYVVQQLALATYKSEFPGAISSLQKAKEVLETLKPDTSSDAETAGLWGAIHKRLWARTKEPADLDKAIRSYGRGYYIKDDYYNGINYAFLLNARASVTDGDDALVDRKLAQRIRAAVLKICDDLIESDAKKPADAPDKMKEDDLFWIKATKVEALLGLNRGPESDEMRTTLLAGIALDDWRVTSLNSQLTALVELKP
jgi:hypothetical protein